MLKITYETSKNVPLFNNTAPVVSPMGKEVGLLLGMGGGGTNIPQSWITNVKPHVATVRSHFGIGA